MKKLIVLWAVLICNSASGGFIQFDNSSGETVSIGGYLQTVVFEPSDTFSDVVIETDNYSYSHSIANPVWETQENSIVRISDWRDFWNYGQPVGYTKIRFTFPNIFTNTLEIQFVGIADVGVSFRADIVPEPQSLIILLFCVGFILLRRRE